MKLPFSTLSTLSTNIAACLLLLFSLASGSAAEAQNSPVPAARPKAGALTASEAYQKGKAVALKWNADAQLTELQNTSEGPLDLAGRATDWSLHWVSKNANKTNLMSIRNGAVQPFEVNGAATRAIVIDATTMFDSAKLIEIAQGMGGREILAANPKATIELGLVENRNVPLWHVSYSGADQKQLLHIAVDGNTGKVTKF